MSGAHCSCFRLLQTPARHSLNNKVLSRLSPSAASVLKRSSVYYRPLLTLRSRNMSSVSAARHPANIWRPIL